MTSYLSWLLVIAALLLPSGEVSAAPCTAQDFATAVDQSGANLRTFNREAQPKLQDRMRRYAEAKKLPAVGAEDAALDAIQDEKLTALDAKSGGLLLRVDSLGRVSGSAAPDCAKLDEIKFLSREILEVMTEKSSYMLARLDAKIAEAGGGGGGSPVVAKPAPAAPPPETSADKPAEKAPSDKQAAAPLKPEEAWPATTKSNDAYVPLPSAGAPAVASAAGDNGYSIDEIQVATRGFFGSVSTSVASVIEHAFKTTGRPSAYVLGTEGGGAFLAGLRFGEGTLFMRSQPGTRQVYWHGPSLGTDFGASGSRTMFLIYKMQEPDALFRTFTGVDGSAYFVGGVGVTLLKGGDVIMAPIRTGLGFRLGANVGYVRFSDKPTWNPF